jgi:hypothetical protein
MSFREVMITRRTECFVAGRRDGARAESRGSRDRTTTGLVVADPMDLQWCLPQNFRNAPLVWSTGK